MKITNGVFLSKLRNELTVENKTIKESQNILVRRIDV